MFPHEHVKIQFSTNYTFNVISTKTLAFWKSDSRIPIRILKNSENWRFTLPHIKIYYQSHKRKKCETDLRTDYIIYIGTWFDLLINHWEKYQFFCRWQWKKLAHYLEKKLGSHHLSIYKVELHEERRPKCERLNYKISGKKVGDLDSGMKNDFLSKFQKKIRGKKLIDIIH